MTPDTSRTQAEALDREDELAVFRSEFHFPAHARAYLCGHSLGLAPHRAVQLVNEELTAWQRLGVEGHFESTRPWLSYHEQLAPGFARLAGAHPHEVVAMNSLTVNLHLMLTSFYRPTRERYKILIEGGAFPSDRYAVESHLQLHGFDAGALRVFGSATGEALDEQALCDLLAREGHSIATVLWPGVQYLSGQRFDLTRIAAAARQAGCTIGFDLAHAIGNVSLNLHDSGADFAVWCGYKYLNGGPGALGGCFVHERHSTTPALPRLAGWWGHDKASRFKMPDEFIPIRGAEGWQVSNPPIFAAAPLLASLEQFERADMARLRRKSLALTRYCAELLQKNLHGEVDIVTPLADGMHGSQLSLRLHRETKTARAVYDRLQERGVICDWREPDIVRISLAPLYNNHCDAWTFVAELEQALA